MSHVTVDDSTVVPSIITRLTIKPGSWRSMRNIKSNCSETAAMMARLFDGCTLCMRAYSVDNIMYYVTTAQIKSQADLARNTWEPCYLGPFFEEKVTNLIARFGSGLTAMSIDSLYLAESRDTLLNMLSKLPSAPVVGTQMAG